MCDIEIYVDTCDPAGLDRLQKLIDEKRFELGCGRYSTGKLYRIVQIDRYVLVYVGSTIRPLDNRFSGHRGHWKNSNDGYSEYVRSNGGPGNFRIELIMNYPCRSLQELTDKEGYFIRIMKPLCNIMMTGLTNTANRCVEISASSQSESLKYDDLEELCESQVSIMCNRRLTLQQAAAVRKFTIARTVFATSHQFVASRDAVALFDGFDHPLHYRWFKNVFCMHHGQPLQSTQLNAAEKLLVPAGSKAFIKCLAADDEICRRFRELVDMLGYQSFHDTQSTVCREFITQKLSLLGNTVGQIKYLIDNPKKPATGAPACTATFRSVTIGLNTIFSSWLGLSFVNVEDRKLKQGGADRPCAYRLSYQNDYSRFLYTCGLV